MHRIDRFLQKGNPIDGYLFAPLKTDIFRPSDAVFWVAAVFVSVIKRPLTTNHKRPFKVEAAGIEPASRDISMQASTSVVG